MGFCGHIGEGWVDTPQTYVDALEFVGAKIMREDLKWAKTEASLGSYAFPGVDSALIRLDSAMSIAEASGINTLVILDYGNSLYGPDSPVGYKGGLPLTEEERTGFANYSAFLAGELSTRPVEYEVWNEWNIPLGATATEKADGAYLDPTKYDLLVSDTYAAIKAINPEAFIWAGVVSDPMGLEDKNNSWFEEYINISDWANHLDGFSFHHYLIPLVPEHTFWQVRGIAERARKMAGRADLPIMLSETGWFNGTDPFSVTEDVAADYYSRIPFLLRCSGLNQVVFYALRDDGISGAKEDNFGVFTSTYVAKPAANVLADVLPLVNSATSAEYWCNTTRHIVFLSQSTSVAVWEEITLGDSVSFTIASSSDQTLTIKEAGGSSYTENLTVGTNVITIPLTVRSKIFTLPENSSIISFE